MISDEFRETVESIIRRRIGIALRFFVDSDAFKCNDSPVKRRTASGLIEEVLVALPALCFKSEAFFAESAFKAAFYYKLAFNDIPEAGKSAFRFRGKFPEDEADELEKNIRYSFRTIGNEEAVKAEVENVIQAWVLRHASWQGQAERLYSKWLASVPGETIVEKVENLA